MSTEFADLPFKPRSLFAGSPIRAMDSLEHAVAADGTEQANVTSTSFTAWDPEITVLFEAPTSGRVIVIVAARFDEDGNNNRGHAAPQIRKSDRNGKIIQSPGISANSCTSSSVDAPLFQPVCRLTIVDDLIPGHTYWAQLMVSVTGGTTADIADGKLYIIPAQ